MFQSLATRRELASDENVVDGDVDQLDEEADEAHDHEADGSGDSDLHELCKDEQEVKKWL